MAEEVHEHFDAEGNLIGRTVVTRESLWDDASRARAMRLYEYDKSIDSETGLPIEDAFRDQPFIVHHKVINYAARALERQRKALIAEHEDVAGWADGRRFIVQKPSPEQVAAHMARLESRREAPPDPD